MAKGKDRDRKADIAACILAGGKNSRMNGRKKAFLPVEETVFWKKIAAKLSGCSAIYISVEDRKKYEQTQADVGECGFEGFPLVEDLEKKKDLLVGFTVFLRPVRSRQFFLYHAICRKWIRN